MQIVWLCKAYINYYCAAKKEQRPMAEKNKFPYPAEML